MQKLNVDEEIVSHWTMKCRSKSSIRNIHWDAIPLKHLWSKFGWSST